MESPRYTAIYQTPVSGLRPFPRPFCASPTADTCVQPKVSSACTEFGGLSHAMEVTRSAICPPTHRRTRRAGGTGNIPHCHPYERSSALELVMLSFQFRS